MSDTETMKKVVLSFVRWWCWWRHVLIRTFARVDGNGSVASAVMMTRDTVACAGAGSHVVDGGVYRWRDHAM